MPSFSDTYQAFLRQLVKTQCLYKGDGAEDLRVVQRQEQLFELLGDVSESPTGEQVKEFITLFADVCETAKKKRPYAVWGDTVMFDTVCKLLEKKGNKAHRLFFCNQGRLQTSINVGSIVLNQSKHNGIQIRNFLYILFIEACDAFYSDKHPMPSAVRGVYQGLLSFFESHDQSKEDIHSHINELVHDILKFSGLVPPETVKQVCDKFDTVTKDVILNLDADKQAIIQSLLEKLDKNTILEGINQIRDIVGTVDFSPLMPVVSKVMAASSSSEPFNFGEVGSSLIKALEEMGVYQLIKDWVSSDNLFNGIEEVVHNLLGENKDVEQNIKESFDKLSNDETLSNLFGKDVQESLDRLSSDETFSNLKESLGKLNKDDLKESLDWFMGKGLDKKMESITKMLKDTDLSKVVDEVKSGIQKIPKPNIV